jgi:hypothetical protein
MKSIFGGVAALATLSAAPVLAQSATEPAPVIAAAPLTIAAPVTTNAVLR